MTKHPPFAEVQASRPDFDQGYERHHTKTPAPEWKLGDGPNQLPGARELTDARAEWRAVDPKDHPAGDVYKMMISSITPRPVAFMSTMDKEGVCNLAPMSYFNMMAHNPPTIVVGIEASGAHEAGLKDTVRNVLETKEFCCSIISEPFVEAANSTSINAPGVVDEWEVAGLTKRPSETVKPPHVAESAFSMECELSHYHQIKTDEGKLSSTVVFGRVKRFQAKEFLFNPEDPMRIQFDKLQPVCRLGGLSYGRVLQMYELQRPVWDEVKGELPSKLSGQGSEP